MAWAPARPCAQAGCPALIRGKSSRCPTHARQLPTRTQRGYTNAWLRVSRAAIKAQPWCSQCFHTGSKANPLTGDHILARKHGGSDDPSNVQVLCRVCNDMKGTR